MMRQGRRRCARDRGTALSSTEGGSRATRRGCERGRRARTKETHVIHARLRGACPRASSRHGGVAASAASAGAVNAVVFLELAGGRPTRRELLFLGAGGGSISLAGDFSGRGSRDVDCARRGAPTPPDARSDHVRARGLRRRLAPRAPLVLVRRPALPGASPPRSPPRETVKKKERPGPHPALPPPSERPSDPARPPPPPRRT